MDTSLLEESFTVLDHYFAQNIILILDLESRLNLERKRLLIREILFEVQFI